MSATVNTVRIDLAGLCQLQAQAHRLRLPGHRARSRTQRGRHRQRRPGPGMDFAEVRAYQPGDDIRHIDWRVTARRQEPHTKLFQQEPEQPLWLLCDLNPSLYFASRGCYKSVLAARATAVLAWLGLFSNDRVGGMVLSAQHITHQRPARQRRSVLRLLQLLVSQHEQLAQQPLSGESQLDQALMKMRTLARTPSHIQVISDFCHASENTGKALRALAQHHRVTVLRIQDPLERQALPPGRYPLANPEKPGPEGIFWLDSRRDGRALAALCEKRENTFSELMAGAGIAPVTLSTERDLVTDLMTALH